MVKGLTNTPLWIVAGVVVLSLALMVGTLLLSQAFGMTEGYIPPEERGADAR